MQYDDLKERLTVLIYCCISENYLYFMKRLDMWPLKEELDDSIIHKLKTFHLL